MPEDDNNNGKAFSPLIPHRDSDSDTLDDFTCQKCKHHDRSRWNASSPVLTKLALIALLSASVVMTGLGVIIFGMVWRSNHAWHSSDHAGERGSLYLPTDSLFGDIPYQRVIMQKDARYRDATLPGATPDEPGHNDTFVWTDILPTTMIAVPDPSIYGLSGGGKIWENPKDFDDKTEAWTVSVMHQIHCLADFKTHFKKFKDGNFQLSEGQYSHLTHCVEIVRRNVMCKAELALERPDDPNIWPVQHVSGWGNAHMCRDWDQVMAAIKKFAITRGKNGWRRIRPDDPPLIV